MKTRHFLSQLQHDHIVAAIREAEKKTSGEIRVFISHRPAEAPAPVARAPFFKLGMDKPRHRNGVLLFVAPRSHKFAVIGDTGVHSRCGDSFWRDLAAGMAGPFA